MSFFKKLTKEFDNLKATFTDEPKDEKKNTDKEGKEGKESKPHDGKIMPRIYRSC